MLPNAPSALIPSLLNLMRRWRGSTRHHASLRRRKEQRRSLPIKRTWLKTRAACGNEVACLVSRFRERIAELEREASPAEGVSTALDCSEALADARKVSSSIRFAFKPRGKVIPSRQLDLTYSGAMPGGLPLYIVVDLPADSRLFGKGFLSLTAHARGPGGLAYATDRVRAIVPPNAGTSVARGSISFRILSAGPHEAGFSVVTGGRCGEELLQSQRIPVKVELGSPELIVQDVTVGDQPQSVVYDRTGSVSLNIYSAHYEVLDRVTGSLLLRRPGSKARFSPTGRFVVSVSAEDGKFDVVDVLDGASIGQFPPGVLAWARNDSFIVAGGTSRTRINITMSSLNSAMKFETTMANQQAAWWEDEMVLDIDRLFFAATTVDGSAYWDLVSGERSLQSDPDRGAALRRLVSDQRDIDVSQSGPRWKLGEAIQITHDDWLEFGNVMSASPQDFVLTGSDRATGSTLLPRISETSDPCENRRRGLVRIDNRNTLRAQHIAGRGLLRLPQSAVTTPEEDIFARIADQIGPLAAIEPADIGRYGGWWDDDSDRRARLDKLVALLRRTVPQFNAGVSLLHKEDFSGFGNCRTGLHAFDPRHIVRSWRWKHEEGQAVAYLECHMGSGWVRYANLFLVAGGKVRNLSLALMSDEERAGASDGEETAQSVFGYAENDGSDVRVAAVGETHLLISWSFSGRAAVVDRRTGRRVGALLIITEASVLRAMRMTQDGRYLVHLNHDGRFTVLRVSDSAQILVGAHVGDEVVVMSMDGRFDTSYEGAHSLLCPFSRPWRHPDCAPVSLRALSAWPRKGDTVGRGSCGSARRDRCATHRRRFARRSRRRHAVAHDPGVRRNHAGRGAGNDRRATCGTLSPPRGECSTRGADRGSRWRTLGDGHRDGWRWAFQCTQGDPASTTYHERGVLRSVLVGIDAYRSDLGIPPLQFARSDAERLQAALNISGANYEKQVDATVLVDEKANRATILSAVRRAVTEMSSDDTLVFSFAGHAIGSDNTGRSGQLLLALSETRLDDLEQTALSWTDVAAELASARGKVIIVLDACHSGLAGESSLATNDDLAGQLVSMSGAPLVVIAASKGRQVALEDGRKGGRIFTSALVDTLSKGRGAADVDANGMIDLGELYSSVKAKVLNETGGKQSPWLARNLLAGEMTLF